MKASAKKDVVANARTQVVHHAMSVSRALREAADAIDRDIKTRQATNSEFHLGNDIDSTVKWAVANLRLGTMHMYIADALDVMLMEEED